MNRRSFITKALAAVAVVPIVEKLVNSQPKRKYPYTERIVWPGSSNRLYDAKCPVNFSDYQPLLAYRTVTITFNREAFFKQFPNAKRLMREVPQHDYIATLQDDNGDHELKLMSYSFYEDSVKVEAAVIRCRDAAACLLNCHGSDFLTWERIQEHYEAAKQMVSSASS